MLESSQMDMNERLIFALDVANEPEADKAVEELGGTISFFKVGLELYTQTGLSYAKKLKKQNYKVFVDIKIPDDVDMTITRTISLVADAGIDFVTIHGNGKTARLAKEAKGNSDLKILAVTLLSNMDEFDICDVASIDHDSFRRKYQNLDAFILDRALKSLNAGCDGLISSGQDVSVLRRAFPNALIVSPGIRPSGHAVNEHKRAATPGEAIRAGANYLVVGRPIRDAQDKREMAERIIAEMDSAIPSPV
jgi:orotidine-5'-phosphate decarboxylase